MTKVVAEPGQGALPAVPDVSGLDWAVAFALVDDRLCLYAGGCLGRRVSSSLLGHVVRAVQQEHRRGDVARVRQGGEPVVDLGHLVGGAADSTSMTQTSLRRVWAARKPSHETAASPTPA